MKHIGIIGGGPAGLMAAEALSGAGHRVTIYDSMPTVGRKFLMAGKSGLNLTHAEPHEDFVARFGAAADRLRPALDAFTGADARAWASGLGQETFIGSSGRVFPVAMKASPLLRAWLARLEAQGVKVLTRHRWMGFENSENTIASLSPSPPAPLPQGERGRGASTGASFPSPLVGEGGLSRSERSDEGARSLLMEQYIRLAFQTPTGPQTHHFDAVILALGGASWPRLGSDATWVPLLAAQGIAVHTFRPANCGFDVPWSPLFAERFAGQPVKSVASGETRGEFVITRTGIEGSLVYARSAALRDALAANGTAALVLDLLPGRDDVRIERDLHRAGAKASFSNRLRKAGLDPLKVALLREFASESERADPSALARRIKSLAIPLTAPRPIAEAISTAGGVAWEAVDEHLMLAALPGVFVAGEMLDWEAPTGGYLLTACLATGRWAGQGVLGWLEQAGVSV